MDEAIIRGQMCFLIHDGRMHLEGSELVVDSMSAYYVPEVSRRDGFYECKGRMAVLIKNDELEAELRRRHGEHLRNLGQIRKDMYERMIQDACTPTPKGRFVG